MATTVTVSVGSAGRTYSTLAAACAAIPANLITADEMWVLELYNDSEFTGTGVMGDTSGKTADATRRIVITAAAGHSWQDHVDVRTNPYKYDVSKGVGIRNTSNDIWVIRPGGAYTEVRRLQIKADGTNCRGVNGAVNEGTARQYHDLIIETQSASPLDAFPAALMTNVIGIVCTSSGNGIRLGDGSKAIGCGVIRPSDVAAAGTGFETNYGTNILQSCFVFGFSTAASATGWHATDSKNNATDLATGLPGVSNQHSASYSRFTPFTDAALSTRDFRSIAATTLAANGFRDATLAPNDATGLARSATPTIGPWEISASGGSAGGFFRIPESMAFKPLTGVY